MNRLNEILNVRLFVGALLLVTAAACGGKSSTSYHDPNMDFASLRTIAVMPFTNLSREKLAGERVRDAFFSSLMSTGAVYVIPFGEIARGISRLGMVNPAEPSSEEIVKLATIIKADAFITGAVREYGEVRSGSAIANVVSLSMQMVDARSQKVVWTAASTKGGIGMKDRLLGSGGQPMNDVTEAAVNDIINKLFQ